MTDQPLGTIGPLTNSEALTPNNNADLATHSRALYVGVSGNVRVTLVGDTASTLLENVAAGIPLPIRVKRLHATDTDATGIVALW